MPYLQVSVDPGGVLMSLPECPHRNCEQECEHMGRLLYYAGYPHCEQALIDERCPEGWR